MEFYATRGERQKVLDMNNDFHDIIYKATGSRFLVQALRSYKSYINRSKKMLYFDEDYLSEILSEHRKIIEALEKRDKQMAAEAISIHLEHSQKRAVKIWHVDE